MCRALRICNRYGSKLCVLRAYGAPSYGTARAPFAAGLISILLPSKLTRGRRRIRAAVHREIDMKRITLVLAVAAALAGAACMDFTQKTTMPSSNLQQLAGNWSSSDYIPDPNSCTWTPARYAPGEPGRPGAGNQQLSVE